ncbi:MAG TPA: rhomboid family intramembrane serine protease [Kofleriaceae bacterium]|nr:rhomboid family intramembrane serine protease [Kofleriaceae bacterium]
MLPRLGSSKLVTRWLLVTLVASIIAAVDRGFLSFWAALIPAKILRGELWRLVSWVFVEQGPTSLILTLVAVYKFGSELVDRWGDRRLLRFMLEVVLAASAAMCLIAAVAGRTYVARCGGWAATDALVIAWARQFPDRGLRLYGLLTLRGRDLVMVTVGTAIVFAIYFGPIVTAPELVACLVAAGYPRSRLKAL